MVKKESIYIYIYPTNSELIQKRREACKNPPQYYIDSLTRAMEMFILDGNLISKCSRNARNETINGKFSPKVWKKKLGQIYSDALM